MSNEALKINVSIIGMDEVRDKVVRGEAKAEDVFIIELKPGIAKYLGAGVTGLIYARKGE